MTNHSNKILVVIGPGRSGTSLLMQILHKMGMNLSANLIKGKHENPDGFFEDQDFVQFHKELYKNLSTKPSLPLPDNWFNSPNIQQNKQAFLKIFRKKIETIDPIWGFKDPRTATFLPLWNRIFNGVGVTPVFLLSIRNPSTVVASHQRYYNTDKELAELQWLHRVTDSLYYTATDCFIIHYEDWLTPGAVKIAQDLLRYTGLDDFFNGNVDETINNIVKNNLNRSIYEEHEIQNEYVQKLYNAIKNCRGDKFDREKLMTTVKECRRTMNGFKGWYKAAHKSIQQQERLHKEQNNKYSEIEKEELHEVTLQNNNYLKQLKDLQAENEYLRSQLQYAKPKRKWLKENFALLLSSPVATLRKITCNLGHICKISDYKSNVIKILRKIKQRGRRIKSLWRKEK
jgi:hypothetical protein